MKHDIIHDSVNNYFKTYPITLKDYAVNFTLIVINITDINLFVILLFRTYFNIKRYKRNCQICEGNDL